MAKKADQITTHVTSDQKSQALAIAKHRGFENLSSYLCYLLKADILEQQEAVDKLAPVFGYKKNSDSSDNPVNFMREIKRGIEASVIH
jgi:hypothetical protein